MLRRDTDPNVKLAVALIAEMPDYGTQLDRFRPGSQNEKGSDLWHLFQVNSAPDVANSILTTLNHKKGRDSDAATSLYDTKARARRESSVT